MRAPLLRRGTRAATVVMTTWAAGCAIAMGSTGGSGASSTGEGSPAVMHGVVPFAILMAAALLIAVVWWGDD
jgi:hypothetical protein